MINASFWTGKKVLVTGHTGFKGSWLSLWLNKLGANVQGYALAPATKPNLFDEASIHELLNSRIADIRDPGAMQQVVDDTQPEIIFHLAAQPLVRESFNAPAYTIETNVMGTVNVLNAARKSSSVKAVVVVTTDKCYQNNEWHWGYRENEPLGGHDPYSASKACAELIVQSYRLSFMGHSGEDARPCPVASARAGNVIGGGDWSADRLIPDVLNNIAQSEDVVLRNPNAIRPWQHVLEPLSGYLMLAERLLSEGQKWAEAWNFGPDEQDARPVSWIAEQLIKAMNSDSYCTYDVTHQPHEAQALKLDCSKARQVLGWTPVWTLAECLDDIALWHAAFLQGKDMRAVSLDTIDRFEKSSYDATTR